MKTSLLMAGAIVLCSAYPICRAEEPRFIGEDKVQIKNVTDNSADKSGTGTDSNSMIDQTAVHRESLSPLVEKGKRDITIIEDRDQTYMGSKLYELKNVKAADIAPFVLGAARRYNDESSVEKLSYDDTKKEYLLVNTALDMIEYIDDMVEKLDKASSSKDNNDSIVDGDGIYRFVYYPKHRYFSSMIESASIVSGGDGAYFGDPSVNMFYWKDSKSDGNDTLKWLEVLDRPAPQMEITFKVYEVHDDDFKELGMDFVAWKNGPGAELIGMGADFFDFRSDEQIFANAVNMFSGFGNSWAGMIFAPQFDASFLRILAQKGKAKVETSGILLIPNDPNGSYRIVVTPQFQNISKNDLMEMSVSSGAGANFDLSVNNPMICFDSANKKNATIIFNYLLDMSEVVERNNTGTEFVNRNTINSSITLDGGAEKLLGTFTREQDVEQYNGMKFLGDIPIIKYLCGSVSHSKTFTRFFVTVRADDMPPEANLSEWAGKIISAQEMLDKNKKTN